MTGAVEIAAVVTEEVEIAVVMTEEVETKGMVAVEALPAEALAA